MATTAKGTPYVESSDLVANYPAVSLALAEHIDDFGGKVLQVISTAKTDTYTTTSSTYAAVTGLTVTITPASTTNKILVLAQVSSSLANGNTIGNYKVTRGGTDIYVAASPGSRIAAVYGGFADVNTAGVIISHSIMYLDSPSTTSAITYQVESRNNSGSNAAHVNRSALDANNENFARGASSITVMEISA